MGIAVWDAEVVLGEMHRLHCYIQRALTICKVDMSTKSNTGTLLVELEPCVDSVEGK